MKFKRTFKRKTEEFQNVAIPDRVAAEKTSATRVAAIVERSEGKIWSAIPDDMKTNEKFKQQSLMQKSGEIMADILSDDMKTSGTETGIELNLAVLKFKHTFKRKGE